MSGRSAATEPGVTERGASHTTPVSLRTENTGSVTGLIGSGASSESGSLSHTGSGTCWRTSEGPGARGLIPAGSWPEMAGADSISAPMTSPTTWRYRVCNVASPYSPDEVCIHISLSAQLLTKFPSTGDGSAEGPDAPGSVRDRPCPTQVRVTGCHASGFLRLRCRLARARSEGTTTKRPTGRLSRPRRLDLRWRTLASADPSYVVSSTPNVIVRSGPRRDDRILRNGSCWVPIPCSATAPESALPGGRSWGS